MPAHFAAWQRMFEEEGYAFDERIYYDKVDGCRRQDGAAAVMIGADEARIAAAGDRKETYFLELIERGEFRVFDTSLAFIRSCRAAGLRLATASSSRNARYILEKAGIATEFAAIVGGDDVDRGKPDPSIFLLAARQMALPAANCLVIEDAIACVKAARVAGLFCIGVDRTNRPDRISGANLLVRDLGELDLDEVCEAFASFKPGA